MRDKVVCHLWVQVGYVQSIALFVFVDFQAAMQVHLVCCVESLLAVCHEDCADISFSLFDILVSVLALHRTEDIRAEVI